MALIQLGTADGDTIGNPPLGDYWFFNNSNNSDKYTRRNSSGLDIIYGEGEANTSSNVGTGAGLVKAKVGADLPFKSIISGVALTSTENTNDITIDLDDTAVTPGSYTNVSITVDQQGRITLASSGPASSVYGTNFNQFILSTETNTSAPHNTWVSVINSSTSSLVAGDYELSISYGCNHNATNSDFESRLIFDGVTLGDIFSNGVTHKQEPKDSAGSGGSSGSSQQFGFAKTFPLTLTSGVKPVLFDIRSDDATDLSTVWDVYIKLIRVA